MALREILAFFGMEVDTSELEKGNKVTDQFRDKLLGIGKVVAGAFAVDKVVGFGKELINQADALRESAIALGIVPQHLQTLEFAAGQAGVEVGELRAALAKFNKTAADSAGGKGASATFKKLGVELRNADGSARSTGELFEEAGIAIGKVEDPIERAGLASDLFGKSYAKLLPLFSEGEEGMKKAREEAAALGFVFDDAFLNNSDEINDNLDKLKKGLTGLALQALAPLLPGLVQFTQWAVAGTKAVVKWVKETKILRTVAIALGVRGFLGLLRAIPALVGRMLGMRVAIGALVARVGAWRASLMMLGRAGSRFLLPLARIFWKIIAPVLILDDVLGFLEGRPSGIGKALNKAFGPGTAQAVRDFIHAIGRFLGLFKTAPEVVRAAFADLPKALSKTLGAFGTFLGEWGQQIVEVGLFTVNALTGGWQNFVTKMRALWAGLKLAAVVVWTELKFAGLAVAAAIADAWGEAWNGIVGSAAGALAKIATLVGKVPGFGDVGFELGKAAQSLSEKKTATNAGDEVSALRDRERLSLAAQGDDIAATLTAPARATAPASTSSTTVNAPVNNTNNVQQTFNVTGDASPAAANRIGRAAKSGTRDALNLNATKAATSFQAG
jgi:hypothetical protein